MEIKQWNSKRIQFNEKLYYVILYLVGYKSYRCEIALRLCNLFVVILLIISQLLFNINCVSFLFIFPFILIIEFKLKKISYSIFIFSN